MKDFSLVLFTLGAQSSAGAYLLLGVLSLVSSDTFAASLGIPALSFMLGLLALSGLASFFHLGSPQRAWRALIGLRSSWLSREIGAALLFGILLSLQLVYLLLTGQGALPSGLILLTGMSASLLVYAMSRAYMLRTVPGWNSTHTIFSFFAAALLLGGLMALAFLSNQGAGIGPDMRWPVKGVLLVMAVDGVMCIQKQRNPHHLYGDLRERRQPPAYSPRLHLFLLLLAALALVVPTPTPGLFRIGLALGLVLVGLAVKRIAFYEVGAGT